MAPFWKCNTSRIVKQEQYSGVCAYILCCLSDPLSIQSLHWCSVCMLSLWWKCVVKETLTCRRDGGNHALQLRNCYHPTGQHREVSLGCSGALPAELTTFISMVK